MASSGAEKAVVEVYEKWRKAFQGLDPVLMKSLWDHEYDGVIYIAEEIKDPILDAKSIAAYWDNAPTVLEHIPEWKELERKVAIHGDVAFVFAKTFTRMKIFGVKEMFAGDMRSTFIMHRKNNQWLLIHYHESRALDLDAVLAAG